MKKITLRIDGMMCGMCENHVNDAIRRHFSVQKVKSSHRSGETVIISPEDISEEQLRAALKETGYEILSVSSEDYVKKGLFGR